MNMQEKAMKCGKIAHDIMNNNLLLKRITTVTIIYAGDDLYQSIITDQYEYGVFSKRIPGRITTLPKFLAYNGSQFTVFEYLVLHFISKYTTLINMEPALLPPPKIYMKQEKSYTIKEMIRKIKEIFIL